MASNWIDLSRPITLGMSVYPGDPLFRAVPFATHEEDGYRGSTLTLGSHLGTHLDVPFHYFCDGETLDSFPLDFFFGECAIIDVSSLVGIGSERFASREPGRPATITVEDLAPFEPLFERFPFIFLRTGWSSRFGAPDFYTEFPSLSVATCDWIADFPKLRALGLETPSLVSFPIDPNAQVERESRKPTFHKEFAEFLIDDSRAQEPPPLDSSRDASQTVPLDELEIHADAECHRILLGRRPPILILEGLTNLEALPRYTSQEVVGGKVALDFARVVDVAFPPLPIVGVDGCPVRVAARVKECALSIYRG